MMLLELYTLTQLAVALLSIDYFTYSTTGNGTDFGDLVSYANNAGCSDATRSVYAAGVAPQIQSNMLQRKHPETQQILEI